MLWQIKLSSEQPLQCAKLLQIPFLQNLLQPSEASLYPFTKEETEVHLIN